MNNRGIEGFNTAGRLRTLGHLLFVALCPCFSSRRSRSSPGAFKRLTERTKQPRRIRQPYPPYSPRVAVVLRRLGLCSRHAQGGGQPEQGGAFHKHEPSIKQTHQQNTHSRLHEKRTETFINTSSLRTRNSFIENRSFVENPDSLLFSEDRGARGAVPPPKTRRPLIFP